jgi:peptidoglycan/xylan/chitin deacetylase (PgdA/CDA1 family)
MSSISASNGVLSFKPKSGSYFYETFPCQAASSNGLSGLQFTIKGPSKGSVVVELQTKTSCSTGTYKSYYTQITGLTGNTQTVTIPFTEFSGANANAITGIVWSGFSSTTTTWQLSSVQFACSGSSGGVPSSAAPSAAPSSSKAASSSVVSSVSRAAASSSAVSSSKAGSTTAPSATVASSSVVSASRSTLLTASSAAASGTCSPLLIDDWISQSRLTFLYYNAMEYPSSDDGSATSITVGKPSTYHVEIVPKSGGETYFYSQFPCVNAKNKYGGISLRIKAPKGTTFSVELDGSASCDPNSAVAVTKTSSELGWTFDGTDKLYTIPFSKFNGLNTEKLVTVVFGGLSNTVNFGPMAFYCGDSGKEWVVAPTAGESGASTTVAAPSSTATALVVDKFANADSNNLGNWHGGDEGMGLKYSSGKLTITSTDADYSFYSQLSATCSDFTKYKGSYVHIAYSGSTKFTVALQQHNTGCNADIAPFPETWDSAEASRYAKNGHIYIPMSHFKVDLTRTIGFALKGFYSSEPVTLSVIEIVPSVPADFGIPPKDETGQLIFACKRPNSFAFAIDDGVPELAQEVLKIIREEDIKVTFFTVGAPLMDKSTNLTNVYKEMMAAGHQIAMHSYTHPKMEGLPDYASIDWEYNEDVKAMKSQFDITTPYFRPPFGTEGARMRSRLAKAVGSKATITNWSVDVEDWLWATTNTPEQQKVAFERDVKKGGNLVVLHYLYPSTVSYLKDFIKIAKATGKQLMRVDQCMEDPSAPPLKA